MPTAVEKSVVLHPEVGLNHGIGQSVCEGDLRRRYGIDGPYFYLPNQFWVHKNHRVVADALALLKSRNEHALVVSTGLTEDQRQPGYFESLMHHVQEIGVPDQFRVLGVVPYADVIGLMRGTIAIMSPSLFEGWGLSVAEGKSMGKTMILSDIPVFREQAPEHAYFFPPRSAEALADTMSRVSAVYSKAEDLDRQRRASDVLPKRVEDFGTRYEAIVLETLQRYRGKNKGAHAATS
jgi:glycosyltransferase involved in cell wall biosynthesis